MLTAGRPGRGERARVAARVRDLIGAAPQPDADHPRPRHGAGTAARWRDRVRWDPGRRGVLALGLLAVVVLAATGWWLAAGRPAAMPLAVSSTGPSPSAFGSSPPSTSATPSAAGAPPTPSGAASSGPAPPVVVDVAGRVRRPGVYTLRAGARVIDALRAAGGVRPRASTLNLNLAAPVQDGEQIVVGAAAAAPGGVVPGVVAGVTPAVPAATGVSAPAAPVDLNTATLEQLVALPGVGPVLAQNILDWRAAHQHFASVDQLGEVTGIGDVRLAQLRPLVSV